MMVFASGPGVWMKVKEKMPTTSNNRYWKSYNVRRWAWRSRSVSMGENEVCSEAMDEVGDIRLRNLDRILRRMR